MPGSPDSWGTNRHFAFWRRAIFAELVTFGQNASAASLSRAHRFGAPGIVRLIRRLEFTAFVAEARQMDQAEPLQDKLHRRGQHAESVLHAAPEVDGRSLFEIFCGARDFANTETEMHALCEHLIVEDEVVGVFEERQFRQNLAAEGTVSRVIFRELHAQKKILEAGEQAVRNVLVDGHAAE